VFASLGAAKMPIIGRHNAHFIRFEAELDYSDLAGSTVNASIAYGTFAPEFFIDVNSPVITTLIENQDQRLFELLMDLHREAQHLLEAQLRKNEQERIEDELTRETKVVLRPNRPGYVYLVQADRYFKIGRSKQPNVRFGQIGLQLPFPFEVLHVIPVNDMHIAEKQLHTKYAHQHLNGEWFELSQNEVAEIMSLKSL
jgi:Meiotically up-regulated gene 113